MTSFCKCPLVALLAFCGLLTIAIAAPLATKSSPGGNFYYMYTKALHVDNAGVVSIPSRFKWSVETGFPGVNDQGNISPDTRVQLRLYDPNNNFTALIAQMDMATAARLHHDLGDLIAKKLENPGFEHHPQLYDPKLIPKGNFKGIDENGKVIIELEYPTAEQAR